MGIKLRPTVPEKGKNRDRKGNSFPPICLVPLGLAGKPQRKEMVRVTSQLAWVPAYGLGIGEGRHIPDCPNRLHLVPLLSASCRLSLPFQSSQIHYVPFSWACLASVALTPSEFAPILYLTLHLPVRELGHLYALHSMNSVSFKA